MYQHNALKAFYLQHKGPLKWIPSKTIFSMQVECNTRYASVQQLWKLVNFKFVMYDIVYNEFKKMVTELLGTETNNFKPWIQLPVRKRKQKYATYAI